MYFIKNNIDEISYSVTKFWGQLNYLIAFYTMEKYTVLSKSMVEYKCMSFIGFLTYHCKLKVLIACANTNIKWHKTIFQMVFAMKNKVVKKKYTPYRLVSSYALILFEGNKLYLPYFPKLKNVTGVLL